MCIMPAPPYFTHSHLLLNSPAYQERAATPPLERNEFPPIPGLQAKVTSEVKEEKGYPGAPWPACLFKHLGKSLQRTSLPHLGSRPLFQ